MICVRAEGGVAAEKAERERWIAKEQQKIMDSVNGKWQFVDYCLCIQYLWLVDHPGWCIPEKDCCWL